MRADIEKRSTLKRRLQGLQPYQVNDASQLYRGKANRVSYCSLTYNIIFEMCKRSCFEEACRAVKPSFVQRSEHVT